MSSNVLQVFINSTVYERKYLFYADLMNAVILFKLKMLDLYSELTSLCLPFVAFFLSFSLFFMNQLQYIEIHI